MFVLNPDHLAYTQGTAKRLPNLAPREGRLWFAVWSLAWCLFLLIVVGVPAYRQWAENRTLRTDGVVTAGEILSRTDETQPPYVRFQFIDNAGDTIIGQALGRRAYRADAVEDAVTVRYLPDQPAVNTIDGYYFAPRWQTLGWPLLALLTPLALIWTLTEVRRLVRFRREGRPVPGEVVTARIMTDEDGGEHLTVEYAFDVPGRNTRRRAEASIPRRLNPVAPPAPGTDVTVFYLNERTYQLL